MTEAGWLTGTDPLDLLRSLHVQANDRKPLLFACACVTRIRDLLGTRADPWLEVAEQVAEGRAGLEQLPDESAQNALSELYAGASAAGKGRLRALLDVFTVRWQDDTWDPAEPGWDDADTAAWDQERAAQAVLVRDIFGNPFRPVALDPAWRTRPVLSLAQAAYEDVALPGGTLDLARLAIFADALEDAGCTDVAILAHCRGPGPHVPGCWLLDLVTVRK
jgi:hypothetical protein